MTTPSDDDLCARLRIPLQWDTNSIAFFANLDLVNRGRAQAADRIERARSATAIVAESMRQWELRAEAAEADNRTLREEVERLQAAWIGAEKAEIERLTERVAELEADAARLSTAILWALGYDMGPPDFVTRDGAPRYWWRTELERRAGGHAKLAAALAARNAPREEGKA